MEFAEWVVSGLEQLRAGPLPGGQGLYQAVAAGLGGSPVLDAFMNGGDDAARAALVQAIAQAVAENPGFEQQVRQAAAAAQGAGAGGPAKPPFLKTTNGMLVAVAAAVVVVGGGIGLGVGMSGGGGSLSSALKGTWHCTTTDHSSDGDGSTNHGTLVISDKDWSINGSGGTWKQDGGKVTLTSEEEPGDPLVVTGVPTSTGSVDTQLGQTGGGRFSLHLKGSISSSAMHLVATRETFALNIDCTK
ncbi:MAG: hypothetical protein HOW97_09300 [Catenulispora sp.]|nr:hypothetical protein [Catenulispora sp.]